MDNVTRFRHDHHKPVLGQTLSVATTAVILYFYDIIERISPEYTRERDNFLVDTGIDYILTI